jgi:hypothetical protein
LNRDERDVLVKKLTRRILQYRRGCTSKLLPDDPLRMSVP